MKQRTPLGIVLAKYRIDAELTLAEMAKLLEVSSSYLSFLERGERNITPQFIKRLQETLQLSQEQLEDLQEAVYLSQHTYFISPKREDAKLVATFASNYSKLSYEAKMQILDILNQPKSSANSEQKVNEDANRLH